MNEEQKKRYADLCPPGEYRVIKPDAIDFSPLPSGLLDKCDSMFLAASGDPANDRVYYMANLNRADEKAGAIDQQPFGFVLDSKTDLLSGCLVHHGNWTDRTTAPPSAFWDVIEKSGIGVCYYTNQLPSLSSGQIADVKITSQQQAFSTIIEEIRSKIDKSAQ